MFSRLAQVLIKAYQLIIAPLWQIFFPGNACRFTPTCSEYAMECYQKFGFFKATKKSFFRVLRCNPCCEPGDDPVGEV